MMVIPPNFPACKGEEGRRGGGDEGGVWKDLWGGRGEC